MEHRIGVIYHGSETFRAWERGTGLRNGTFWRIYDLRAVEAIRNMNERLSSLVCLPDWMNMPRALDVRDSAAALVIPLPRRGRAAQVDQDEDVPAILSSGEFIVPGEVGFVNPVDPDENEPPPTYARAPEPTSGDGPDIQTCIGYLRAHHAADFPPGVLDSFPLRDLRRLRAASIQLFAAQGTFRNPNVQVYRYQWQALRDQIVAGVVQPAPPVPWDPEAAIREVSARQILERATAVRERQEREARDVAAIRSEMEARLARERAQRARRVSVGDVLADTMRAAREAEQPEERPARRRHPGA